MDGCSKTITDNIKSFTDDSNNKRQGISGVATQSTVKVSSGEMSEYCASINKTLPTLDHISQIQATKINNLVTDVRIWIGISSQRYCTSGKRHTHYTLIYALTGQLYHFLFHFIILH